MSTQTESASARRCTHGELWLAPDGQWRCERCEPPHFDAEVRGRKTVLEVLSLFDDEDEKFWVDAADWSNVDAA